MMRSCPSQICRSWVNPLWELLILLIRGWGRRKTNNLEQTSTASEKHRH